MLEENNCPRCGYIYEVSWDDHRITPVKFASAYDDDDYDPNEEFDDDEEGGYPHYCPFCGLNRKFGSDEDFEE